MSIYVIQIYVVDLKVVKIKLSVPEPFSSSGLFVIYLDIIESILY